MNRPIKFRAMKMYRHGDIALLSVDAIPPEAKLTDTKVIISNGSGGHAHSITQGKLYFINDSAIIGYLEAKKTQLLHVEHGDVKKGTVKAAKIEDGVYQIKRQQQETHEGMAPVVD